MISSLASKGQDFKLRGIQFHLWHEENTNVALSKNNLTLRNSIKNEIKWCENGINSINKNED